MIADIGEIRREDIATSMFGSVRNTERNSMPVQEAIDLVGKPLFVPELAHEPELMAEYRLSSGWMLRFVCEKCDGPSWSIDIAPSAGGPWFAVWLLMQAFERLT